jgi:hypothetical protein
MQVFVNISSRGCFYSEELCPSVFTGWLELRWAPFLPCSQLLPGTGSIQILFVHSADVVTCTHRRSTPCCTTEPRASSTLPWCGAQSMIRANHCFFPRPCIPTLLRLQLRFATLAGLRFGSCRPQHTCLFDKELPPPVWLRNVLTPASASTPVVAAIHHRPSGSWNH